MDGKSLDIQQTQFEKLKELFPEAINEGKVDWEKLKATLGEDITFSNERYVLNWAGKSDAFKVLQSPTTATLTPAKKESVNFDDTGHIFIEGENLEVLKVLQKSYYGKVKMIYIDPPYNTGNDHFIYPDRFSENKEDYLKRVGEKDEEGYLTREGMYRKNSRDSGHYHSNWLNMMYPRLFLARNLLKDDGVIFVSIDDNEVHNLRLMMNEIFGEENFLGNIVRSTGQTTGQDSGGLGSSFDFILAYSKQVDIDLSGLPLNDHDMKRFNNEDENGKYAYDQLRKTGSADRREDRPNMYYPVVSPDGDEVYPIASGGYEGRWRVEKKRYLQWEKNGLILWKKTKRDNNEIWWPYVKYYLEGRTKRPSPLWTDLEGNKKAARDLRDIFEGEKIFDFPKPISLLKRLVQIAPNASTSDIILDFFGGSGSIAEAIYKLNSTDGGNRKYICVQIAEECEENSRAYKLGYKTITDLAKERIRRVIQKIESEQKAEKKEKARKLDFGDDKEVPKLDLGFKVFKLQPSNFKIWRGHKFENGDQLKRQLDAFTDPTKEGSKEENILYELLLKSGFDLNSKIESKDGYFVVNDTKIVIVLTKMTEAVVKEIISLKPDKCIALDKLFAGNDQLKTNTVLQMRDAGVEFKTI